MKTYKAVFLYIGFIILMLLIYCVNNTGIDEKPELLNHVSNMVKINSQTKSFYMGASDELAGSDEKPLLKHYFSYSYFMDTVEVTQKMYKDIMGLLPEKEFSKYGKGDNYPVYYVSWFDAILFCNARSKSEKLDTVYSWAGAPLKESGSVYNLTGLTTHYDRNGYRLPTESEWEYAAREGSSSMTVPHLSDTVKAGQYAWCSWNAGGQSHPIASKKANAFGLYDMAGNVFEWTADWKGFYTGDSIINSIGSRYPNSQYERVVKGGAFSHGYVNLRPSRRSATYPTSHAIKTEYIGFRCVRGAIPNGNYIGQSSAMVTTNPVTLLVNTLQPVTGSAQTKLVFVNVTRNLRTLCYVDFSTASPQIIEFTDSVNVYMPVISPDGKYAAYSTSGTGSASNANVFIRNLNEPSQLPVRIPTDKAYSPRWWIDPNTADTCIIFTNSTYDNATPEWSNHTTAKVKFVNGQITGTVTQVTSGSFHGGISSDGNFTVSGHTRLVRRDLRTNEDLHMFIYPQNGKNTGGSDQVCNVSVCPGGKDPYRCMFIDFGAFSGSTLVGKGYGVHEYLFISDFSGKVTKWYQCPIGESSWDFPEWSNQEKFAVACGRNTADDSHAVYCINLQDSQYVKMIEGTIIHDPYLWIAMAPDTECNLNPDSLGNYNDPPLYNGQDFFTKRMQNFWFYKDSMEIVAVGSSHLCHALDPNYMPGNKVYNMAFIDCMYTAMFNIIESYLLPHCPRLKFIIMDIFIGGLNSTEEWHKNWNSGVFNSKGFVYDKQHEFWTAGLPKNFLSIMAKAPGPNLPMNVLGVYRTSSNGWGGEKPPVNYAEDWKIDFPDHVKNLARFKSFIDSCGKIGIQCLLVITPESPAYKKTGYFMRYGPTWDNGVAIVNQIKAMTDSIQNCRFYDAYNGGNHDYTDDEAYDSDHLSAAGAKKFSARVDSVITLFRK